MLIKQAVITGLWWDCCYKIVVELKKQKADNNCAIGFFFKEQARPVVLNDYLFSA